MSKPIVLRILWASLGIHLGLFISTWSVVPFVFIFLQSGLIWVVEGLNK